MNFYGDFATYTKPEPDDAPVILWAVWDDAAGIVTIPVASKTEAEKALPVLLAGWCALLAEPGNARIRQLHQHDNGVTADIVPADECGICPAAGTTGCQAA